MKIKKIVSNSVTINTLHTTKFKTTRIQLAFANHLSEETATIRTLLLYMMKTITKKYSTRKDFAIRLEEMYAAGFGGGVKKIGLSHIVSFDLSIINNKYTINNEDLLIDGLQFLKEIVFNPLFTEEIMIEEKRLLDEYYDSIYTNKLKYAILETYKVMFEDETYKTEALGNKEQLKSISLKDIQYAYHSLINNDLINISIVGDINEDDVIEKINNTFHFIPRVIEPKFIDFYQKEIVNVNKIVEKQNVNQGKLVIGHRINAYFPTENYYKANVLNMILGGHSESILFRRVREELGLVYHISSSYQMYKGILMIYAGINPNDYDKVISEVKKVINDLQNGNFDDQYLVLAKNVIINHFIENLDSNGSLLQRVENLSLFNRKFDKDEIINNINKVTKEDVCEIAKLIKEDTIYFLRNDTNEKN